MLLIFPPCAKPCEPPAGVAKLAHALQTHNISCTILDANLEGLLYLLQQPQAASDTWTRRAIKHVAANLAALRNPQAYQSPDQYRRAVKDVNRVLETSAKAYGAVVGLADYHHQHLSPVRSADLIFAAEHYEQNAFYPWFNKRLTELLAEGESVVGFSINYLSQALSAFAMIGYLRKAFPRVRIVLGGGLVTSWMKRPDWKNPFETLVDEMIAGAGEGPLLKMFGVSGDGSGHSLPDYQSLYHNPYLSPGFILPYSASCGCYWNKCSFCPETAEDNPYLPVPVERAMNDLRTLIRQHKPILLHLLDNSVSPALMRAIADEPLGVPWYGFARIGHELTNIDFCMALKRSGCVMLKLGLESGDQGVLDRMHKGIDLAMASQVLQNLHTVGIAAYVYLLFGTPTETIIEARKTLEFVIQHHSAIMFLNLAVFNMPICGEEAREYETGLFYEGDLSLYTGFKHPHGWDRKAIRLFLDTEFKKHPAIAAILKKDPLLFTSNHAAFFV